MQTLVSKNESLGTRAVSGAATDDVRGGLLQSLKQQAFVSLMRDSLGRFPGVVPPSVNLFSGEALSDLAPFGLFKRSTANVRLGQAGVLEHIGPDSIRREWAVGGTLHGWRIEGIGVNNIKYSEDLDNPAWFKSNVFISTEVSPSPDGRENKNKIIESAGVHDQHSIWNSVPTVPDVTYFFSFYAKAAERNVISASIYHSTTMRAVFDLATGEVRAGAGTICPAGNGWYRCAVQFVSTKKIAHARIYLQDGGSLSYEGDGSSGVYVWGCQVEPGHGVSSYIKTTKVPAIRSADVWSKAIDSSWFNRKSGTIFVAARYPEVLGENGQHLVKFDDDTDSNALVIYRDQNKKRFVCRLVADGSAGCALDLEDTDGLDTVRLTLSWSEQGGAASLNGHVCVTNNSFIPPSELTMFRIGASRAGTSQWGGHLYHVAYFPAALSCAALQSITQPFIY